METPEEMISPSKLADELDVTESALAKWRCDGTGPPFCKLGYKVVRYPRSTVEAWKLKRVKGSTRVEVNEHFDVEASP
jgi:predicted DNA-binding transcriptional regulator AlpA